MRSKSASTSAASVRTALLEKVGRSSFVYSLTSCNIATCFVSGHCGDGLFFHDGSGSHTYPERFKKERGMTLQEDVPRTVERTSLILPQQIRRLYDSRSADDVSGDPQ